MICLPSSPCAAVKVRLSNGTGNVVRPFLILTFHASSQSYWPCHQVMLSAVPSSARPGSVRQMWPT